MGRRIRYAAERAARGALPAFSRRGADCNFGTQYVFLP
jgi:hypothetical protein